MSAKNETHPRYITGVHQTNIRTYSAILDTETGDVAPFTDYGIAERRADDLNRGIRAKDDFVWDASVLDSFISEDSETAEIVARVRTAAKAALQQQEEAEQQDEPAPTPRYVLGMHTVLDHTGSENVECPSVLDTATGEVVGFGTKGLAGHYVTVLNDDRLDRDYFDWETPAPNSFTPYHPEDEPTEEEVQQQGEPVEDEPAEAPRFIPGYRHGGTSALLDTETGLIYPFANDSAAHTFAQSLNKGIMEISSFTAIETVTSGFQAHLVEYDEQVRDCIIRVAPEAPNLTPNPAESVTPPPYFEGSVDAPEEETVPAFTTAALDACAAIAAHTFYSYATLAQAKGDDRLTPDQIIGLMTRAATIAVTTIKES